MDTDPERPEDQPLGDGLTDDEEQRAQQQQTEYEPQVDGLDPSDYDPRSYWDDPTGVDGALHGDHTEDPVVNADVDDMGDLGDILPH